MSVSVRNDYSRVVPEATRQRLTVVSNRGPIVHQRRNGERVTRRGGGGLVSALRGLLGAHDVTWVACALTTEDHVVARENQGAATLEHDAAGNAFYLRLADPDPSDYRHAYGEIANPLLWFIQHGLYDLGQSPIVGEQAREAWAAYRRYNATIAAQAAAEQDADALMVHDYQLYLVPAMLRESGVQTPMLHFTHIPWPAPDAWRLLPVDLRTELLHGMLGADIIGFQTDRDVTNFLATCTMNLGDVVVDDANSSVRVTVDHAERDVLVRTYPISIDPSELREHLADPATVAATAALRSTRPERLILRVDRTDPSKNIVRGFHAFDRLLARRPDLHGSVSMLAMLDPSRLAVPEYARYVETIRSTAKDVNARHARDGWLPIDLRIGDTFNEIVAAYQLYDVLLVNAIADGMNVVAKEGPLLNETDGVLVLSEQAGAFAELGPFVFGVDPFDIEQTAAQLERALDLPQPERAARSVALRAFIEEHDVSRWIDAQLRDLNVLRGASA